MTFRCAPTIEKAEKVRVHKYDYVEMVNKVEDVIEKQINKFLQSVTSHVVRVSETISPRVFYLGADQCWS